MRQLNPENIDFQVIGQLKSDPGHLLLMGDDGCWYDYDISAGSITPIDVTDSWAVDVSDQVALRLEIPKDVLAS